MGSFIRQNFARLGVGQAELDYLESLKAPRPCRVSELPDPSLKPNDKGYVGTRFIVTDATATTFNSVVAGGGANVAPIFSDGTNWRIG